MTRKKKTEGPNSPLLIKRYSNRKLYNTRESRYITLNELAELVKSGTNIRVVDNDRGEDLTSVTLSQILLENERHKRDALPKNLLVDLIQKGDDLFDTVKKSLSSGIDLLSDAEGSLEKSVRRLVSRGEIAAEEGEKMVKRLAEWVKDGQSDLGGQIDQRIRKVVSRFDVPERGEVDRLHESIDRLAKAVERLEARPGRKKTGARKGGGAA